MPKKIVQDIVMSGKRRSIRSIGISRNEEIEDDDYKTSKRSRKNTKTDLDDNNNDIETVFIKKPSKKKNKFSPRSLLAFVIILLSISVIVFAFSLSYSKAVVTITPKIVNLNINGTYTAKKDSATDLSYEVLTAKSTATSTVPAIKGPLLQTKSKGIATIFNKNNLNQVLVAGTRISNTDGLVFRTTKTITVPAQKTNPGSIDVVVVADKAGANYNLKSIDTKYDFKLPGYIGMEKYDKFYARLKTDTTGGFSGNKITISEEVKNSAVKLMEESLKDKLLNKIKTVTPANYTYYDSAYNIKYDAGEPIMKDANKAELTLNATIYIAVFKTDILVKSLAGTETKKFPSDTYNIIGDKDLVFKLSNSKDFSAQKGSPMIFTLKGDISIVGTLDEDKLKNELKGLKLEESNAIFNKYGAIGSAYSLITPFWLRFFPDSIEKIKIGYK